jgi:ribosome modulation factor
MQSRKIVVGVVALMLGAAGGRVAGASAMGAAAGQVSLQVQVGGWDAPPRELNDLQRQGFHDGIAGARRDFENHRPMDVNSRDEYRHPRLPGEQREAYRDGFRRGYNVAMSHLMNGPGPGYGPPVQAPPPPRGDWDTVPNEFNDAQRRGFHDGIEGARRDFDNHRQPNVENRDEYRHPSMPHELREAYREGFRRGYDRGWAHLSGRQWRY